MTPPHRSRAVRARLTLAVLSALALVGALLAAPSPASAAPTPPPVLRISAATSSSLASELSGVPVGSRPTVLAAVNQAFDLSVSISPAQTKDITVALSPVNGTGQLGLTQVTIPAGVGATSSVTVSETYGVATPALRIQAAVPSNKKIAGVATDPFRVESFLAVVPGNSGSNLTAGADGSGCTTVGPANPICGIVNLPRGTSSGNAILTIGPCVAGSAHCQPGNVVTQFLADMSSYTAGAPASMTLVCDKSLCGKGGVNKYTALWSESATGALSASPPCPSKGVIGAGQTYCTDYVSSRRDNAADLLLVVLFVQDVRGTI